MMLKKNELAKYNNQTVHIIISSQRLLPYDDGNY